jgi:hypothetical protein
LLNKRKQIGIDPIRMSRRHAAWKSRVGLGGVSRFNNLTDRRKREEHKKKKSAGLLKNELAGTTGLEPAASAVTGQRSNQLNYVPTRQINEMRNRQCL